MTFLDARSSYCKPPNEKIRLFEDCALYGKTNRKASYLNYNPVKLYK